MSTSTLTPAHALFLSAGLGVKLKRFKTERGAKKDFKKYLRRLEKTKAAAGELQGLNPQAPDIARIDGELKDIDDAMLAGTMSIADSYKALDAIKIGARDLVALWKERQAMFVGEGGDEDLARRCATGYADIEPLLDRVNFSRHKDPAAVQVIEREVARARSLQAETPPNHTDAWLALGVAFNSAKAELARIKAKDLKLDGDGDLIAAQAEARAELPAEMIAWVDARNAASRDIDRLRAIASTDAVALAKELSAAEKTLGSQPTPQALVAATTAARRITTACGTKTAETETALRAALEPLAEALARIETAYTAISADAAVPQAYRDRMLLRVKAARSVAACTNIDAARAALPVLRETEESLAEVKVLANLFETTSTRIGEVDRALADATLAAQLQPEKIRLQKEWDDGLKKTALTMDPARGLAAVDEFLEQVQEKVALAGQIKAWRKEGFTTTGGEIDALFAELDSVIKSNRRTPAKAYSGPLVGEYQNITSAAGRTGTDPRSPFEIATTRLKTKIQTYYLHGMTPDGMSLIDEQVQADADKIARDEALKNWTKHQYKAFANALDRVKGAVTTAGGDLDEIASLKRMGEGADSMAKNFDFEGAQKRLGFTYRQLYELERNPQGSKSVAKGELGKLRKLWSDAVDGLEDALRAMATSIAAECEAEGVAVPDGLTDRLGSIADHFDAKAFDLHLATLVTDGPTMAERKASREEALRIVRRYQDQLRKNPVVAAVIMNPFQGGVMTPLYNALKSLDLNLQRCL